MPNDELNQLIEVARKAAFFIRSIDGYENSKIANELCDLSDKVEGQKLLVIGRLAARVVYRNSKKAEQSAHATITNFESFHPRAVKLLRKKKNFIVIAEDEPYFVEAYSLIRKYEISKGRWTDEDEHIYQSTQPDKETKYE